jgi:hypothetical protein
VASLFVIDVPEYEPLWRCAVGDGELAVRHIGPYVELTFSDAVTIDRKATGVRHAVWYSGVGALKDARIVQFDKDALRVVASPSGAAGP